MNKKSILIIGGTGFIGYHLAKKAIEKKFNVTSISTKQPKKIRHLKKVKYILCNISNKKKLNSVIKGKFEYVVNLGGYVDHSNKTKTLKSHYNGCKNLAKIFLNKPPKMFLQIGSSVEYGFKKSPQKEILKIDIKSNKSTYGKAKLLASRYLINLYKKKNFPATILRLYLAYGPKQDQNRLIPITIMSCLKDQTFNCSSGNQIRDFIYIDDIIRAIFKLLKSNRSKGQIFNIGSGKPITVMSVIEKIRKISKGGFPLYGKIKFRKDEIKKLYPDIKKIKKEINWKPNISFDKGIKLTIKSYKDSLYKI